MDNKFKVFIPDYNNTGGRDCIRKTVYNHRSELAKITLKKEKKRAKTAKIPLKNDKIVSIKTKIKKEEEFKMALNTFKKISQIKKGEIDDKKPNTFELKKNLINKKNRNENYINKEHENNLKVHFKKVSSQRNALDRKKNLFDPIAYPALIVKKIPPKKKEGLINNLFSCTTNQRVLRK